MRVNVGATLLLATAACAAEPTIDGSSNEAMGTSIEVVRAAFGTDSLRAQFDTAMMVVALKDLDLENLFGQALTDPTGATFAAGIRDQLSGRTGPEILALGDSIRAAILAEQLREARSEIQELEAKRTAAEAAREWTGELGDT